jgi:hypothetical protein
MRGTLATDRHFMAGTRARKQKRLDRRKGADQRNDPIGSSSLVALPNTKVSTNTIV